MPAFYGARHRKAKRITKEEKHRVDAARRSRHQERVRCFPNLLGLAAAIAATGLPARADESALARGAYLARITGCIGCHTPRTPAGGVVEDKLASGGDHPIPSGPKVRIYPPNITPDMETGIGRWPVADIVAAIKAGAAPGGGRLSSAMPSRSQFARMTDTDAAAIAAYLKSVPAIRHSVPPPVSADVKPATPN